MGDGERMKSEYVEDVNLELENGHSELYFVAHEFDIGVNDMDKRVRVFINQLLPQIVNEVQELSDLQFAFDVLGRHVHRFTPKLVKADKPDELLIVLIAVSETITKLFKKQRELVERDQGKISEVPR